MKIVALLVALATIVTVSLAIAQTGEEGVANFYSDKFQGKKTASGEVYDKGGLTASHGKSVVVTVNDRMTVSNPAIIDVTRRAAEELGFVQSGKAKVKLEVQK